jgi:hypothetical protein
VRAVFDRWHDLTPGRSVGAELVCDHSPRRAALLLEQLPQQPLGSLRIPAALNQDV